GLAAAAYDLSPTSYLGPRAIPSFFRGGKVTSGLSSLRLAEGSCNGGDEVEAASSHISGVVVEKESEMVVKTKGIMVMLVEKT
nr:hypothetical protein [Tanacetum cinerariifolium]